MIKNSMTVAKAMAQYLATLDAEEKRKQQQELNRFARWCGASRSIDQIKVTELDNYGGHISDQNDPLEKLRPVKAFFSYAKKAKITETNLGVHIRVKKTSGRHTVKKSGKKVATISLTQQGFEDLKEELEKLIAERPRIAETIRLAAADKAAHRNEHSIEVQVPFIQYLFGGAKIVPIVVTPSRSAVALGESVGEIIAGSGKNVVCLGSTDLTHYGPHYGFEPVGGGDEAFLWAKEVNDRQFINYALKMDPDGMLNHAAENFSACGAGAAAALVAAAGKLGAERGVELGHTNSSEIMRQKMGSRSQDSVGYAAIVF